MSDCFSSVIRVSKRGNGKTGCEEKREEERER